MLYPLKFKPILKERIWGSDRLEREFGKGKLKGRATDEVPIGESWEVSGLQGDMSVVKNGSLRGNTLGELLEIFMGELVGESVFEKFGEEFPLLIKLIDARDVLSIQVHPDDDLAMERHEAYGKTELWYVVQSDENGSLYVGFNKEYTSDEYLNHLENNTIEQILKRETVKAGSAFFIPAGTVHAIGSGVVIAEIQQSSDITYRLYDWGRVDAKGNPRELHTDLALDAINFGKPENYNVTPHTKSGKMSPLNKCKYFTTNIIDVHGKMNRDYARLDSFVIYICVEGDVDLQWDGGKEHLGLGETILIPAVMDEITVGGNGKILEVYI